MPGDLDSPTRFYSLSSKNQLMGPKGELDGTKSVCVLYLCVVVFFLFFSLSLFIPWEIPLISSFYCLTIIITVR